MNIHSFYIFSALFYIATSNFLNATHVPASHTAYASVRLASADDLKTIMALDATISYEYFKPLFLQYPEFEGKDLDVEKMLADEVEADTAWFISCIAMDRQQRLYVAYDASNLIGFVTCHKQNDTIVIIDLLMIDAEYRGKGIGKQLIQQCIQAFPEVSSCMLVVLDKNKQACAAYEKMGFALMDEKPPFVQEKYPKSRYLCYFICLQKDKVL